MDSKQLREICIAALEEASVSRGAHQGKLKKTCPKSGTDGAAAWQAMALHSNPHKCSVGALVMFSETRPCPAGRASNVPGRRCAAPGRPIPAPARLPLPAPIAYDPTARRWRFINLLRVIA
jgi:hypothetical protein